MLITCDTDLRKYLPNALATVEGESSLYDKLDFFLAASERWLAEHFTGTTVLVEISAMEPSTPIRMLACQIVVADAFARAIPSLDLVLTPNGFGIVSNNNLAPASADRVNRLLSSLHTNRDWLLDQLLSLLPAYHDWASSPQGLFFASTLFPRFSLVTALGKDENVWHSYQSLRSQLVSIEDELAEKYISLELYRRFRQHILLQTVSAEELSIIEPLKQIEVDLLAGKRLNYELLISLVERIRQNTTDFAEWQTSSTAQYFQPQRFQNEKKSRGYWW